MLQSFHSKKAGLPVIEDFFRKPLGTGEFSDMGLKVHSEENLWFLRHGVREDVFEKGRGMLSDRYPLPRLMDGKFGSSRAVNTSDTVDREQPVNRLPVNHGKGASALVVASTARVDSLVDHDAPLSVEEAREVDIVVFHLGSDEMVANSVEAKNSQYRAKQAERLGACREQVPPAKAKVCSELTRDSERAAETTAPDVRCGGHQVTGCYNQTLLSTVRYVDPLKNADLSFGGLYYQDMPWYWDRNCPTGRLYILNSRYVHFYVDPLMMFRWSESRTWPNQLVDIRILSLRLALVYKARMFATVLDGWTA